MIEVVEPEEEEFTKYSAKPKFWRLSAAHWKKITIKYNLEEAP